MRTSHTLGPWEALFNGTIMATVDESRPMLDVMVGTAFAPRGMGVAGFEMQAANARLMAAAPELLAELDRQINSEYNPCDQDNQSAAYRRMVALRAKATGATGPGFGHVDLQDLAQRINTSTA